MFEIIPILKIHFIMISDEILSVIMDIGSFYVRCGFSGEDAPRHHSTSKVGLLPVSEFSKN